MQNIDPITIIIFIPLLDRFLYPYLRRRNIPLRPITRITLGFAFGALAMAYAAWVQHLIYSAPPCYTRPLHCAAAAAATLDTATPSGEAVVAHNQVNVLVQTPAYILVALSEIFASVTGLEHAFTQAPASMKSVVNAVFLLMTAAGAMIAAVIAPLAKDPRLVGMYLGLAVTSAGTGGVFWWVFRRGDGADAVEKGVGEESIPLAVVGDGGHEE
jgi:proton-dependent oligopeptide transporter, POT family